MIHWTTAAWAGVALAAGASQNFPMNTEPARPPVDPAYATAIQLTSAMVDDARVRSLAEKHGLDLLNLTWEDTGRFKGSSVGPNISDMTIQVKHGEERALMPVIRFPNFSDKTGDLDPSEFTLLVGNHEGQPLKRVSLREFLEYPSRYLSDPGSWKKPRRERTLIAKRDEKVLVSAQACFLPVPKQGKATFNPVLFNYQSSPGNPAVLTILATREGTSVAVVENRPEDTWNWGQTLFHNSNGQRASFTGQRLSEFIEQGRPGIEQGGVEVADEALNMVLLIQVPLKYKHVRRQLYGMPLGGFGGGGGVTLEAAPMAKDSNVEEAVIGHGEEEGPFVEMNGLPVERDPRFPVRVTVQFYKATSNGVADEDDLAKIAQQIESIYARTSNVGSLVTDGRTGRITEYDGPKVQPPHWWDRFWSRYESWSGVTRDEARRRLHALLGEGYETRPVTELYLRDCLRTR